MMYANKKSSNQAPGSQNVRIDLENWMGQLPVSLTQMPLIHLAIPGSHNSFSYSISPDQGVSPDSPQVVQSLGKWCKPLRNHVIFKWSQGQKIDVVKQLNAGIRYYDVRLVLNDDEIVIAHGLYGGHIQGFLEQINMFLESHPREVVILDFQHFYDFTPQHHERMLSMLMTIFGEKICQRKRRMRENTLEILRELNQQILIVYRHQVTTFNDFIWPSATWATPWPDKIEVEELIDFLNKGLKTRKDGIGYVSQGILTPTAKYVAKHVFGSLRNLANKSNKKIIGWVESKNNGADGINVVICDFVEKYNFCERVIRLNYKDCTNQTIITDVNQNQGVKQVPDPNQNQGVEHVPDPNQNQGVEHVPDPNQNQGVKPVPGPNQNQAVKPVPGPNQNQAVKPAPGPNQNQGVKSAPDPVKKKN